MKKTIASLCAVILAAAAAAPAGAEEWQTLGPRAVGMGGAGVAVAQGPVASYWNPASLGLATENAYGLQLPVGVHAALTGPVVAGANDLKNVINSCKAGSAGCTQANATAALAEINNPSDGLRANVAGGGDFKVGKLAFFANDFLDVGAVPIADMTNNQATAGSNPNSIVNNNSGLIVKGANVTEFGAGYGHELPFAPGLFLGANLKVMRAEVGYADATIADHGNGSNDITKQFKSSATTSANFGVDAGLLWDVDRTFAGAIMHPRIGLTGRNLNSPSFKQSTWVAPAGASTVPGKYTENAQVRMGAAISPFHWWNIAADMDLTNNQTQVSGIDSRQFGLGSEFNVFNRSWINIPLRVGLSRNLAETNAGTMLSGGVGINFLHLIIDVSGTASPKMIDTQTQGKTSKLPQEFGGAFALSFLFGGSEAGRRAPKPAMDEQPDMAPTAAPAPASNTLPPAQVDQVKQNAAQSQKEMEQQAAPAK